MYVNMKSFYKRIVVFTLILLYLPILKAQNSVEVRPNIIFFLVDDMGWQDTSVPFWDNITKANKITFKYLIVY